MGVSANGRVGVWACGRHGDDLRTKARSAEKNLA